MLPQTPTKKYVGSIVTCTQLNVMLKWERSSTYTCTWKKESLQWNLAGKRVDLCKDRSTYQPLPTLLSRWTAYLLRIFFFWECCQHDHVDIRCIGCLVPPKRAGELLQTEHVRQHFHETFITFFFTPLFYLWQTFLILVQNVHLGHMQENQVMRRWNGVHKCCSPEALKIFFFFFLWSSLLRFLGEHLCPTPLSPIFFFTYVDNSKMPAAQCKKLPFFYASLVVYLY